MTKFGTIYIIGYGVMGKLIQKRIDDFGPHPDAVVIYDKNNRIEVADGTFEKPNLVLICTPISSILSTLKTLKGFNIPNTYVVEIGSTKGNHEAYNEIVYKSSYNFDMCHPMVGPLAEWDKKDWDAVCLCSDIAFKVVREFWESLGFTLKHYDVKTHDEIIGKLSHLIHFTVKEFVNFVESNTTPEQREMAGSSWYKFKDMAAGAERLGDIYGSNDKLPDIIEKFAAHLKDKANGLS